MATSTPPSKHAFSTEEQRDDYTLRLMNIAPTQLNRELRARDLEDILDSIEAISWVPTDRVQLNAGTIENIYTVYHQPDGTTSTELTLWHMRDGTVRRDNALRFDPGFPDDIKWELVTEIFHHISANREGHAEIAPLHTEGPITPTGRLVKKASDKAVETYYEKSTEALSTLQSQFETVDPHDYETLKGIIDAYRLKMNEARDQLSCTIPSQE